MSEINVTPFVDVLLVLLVIFIVAAPMLTVGVPVKLPRTTATALPAENEEPLALTVFADGTLALQSSAIGFDELLPKLREVMAERSSKRIYIRGDAEARYELIMVVMGALNKEGYRDIGLVTESGGPGLETPSE